jgi:predicted metal-dependent hydrolase
VDLNCGMQSIGQRLLELISPGASSHEDWLEVGGQRLRLSVVRNPRARRYVLRLRPDGTARVTVPRGGSVVEARRFAKRNLAWLEKQLQRPPLHPPSPAEWRLGSEVLFRGELERLETWAQANHEIRLATETLIAPDLSADLRPAVEGHLRRLAGRELPQRVLELATLHQLSVRRVTVRDQRSRWGSCSRRGTVSLNWRLIQTPPFVCDYIILHELMHLREMNHSAKFWHHVERVCSDYLRAEQWLKQHSRILRS